MVSAIGDYGHVIQRVTGIVFGESVVSSYGWEGHGMVVVVTHASTR